LALVRAGFTVYSGGNLRQLPGRGGWLPTHDPYRGAGRRSASGWPPAGTLQVIEFMAAHGRNKDGDYSCHYCADFQIRANSDKPVYTRFPAEQRSMTGK
jgi:hypothetical protein